MSGYAARLKERLARERRSLRTTLAFIAVAVAAHYAARGLAEEAASLIEAAATIAVGIGIIKLVGIVLLRLGAAALGAVVPRIAEDIAVVLGAIVWTMLRLHVAGVDPSSLVATSALITGVVAFSMQDTLGNVLGGVLLELEHSIAIGDWIRFDDLAGRVIEIRWRHTTIRTSNGERVIVPNATLIKSRFTVLGNPEHDEVRVRRWIWFDVDFDVPAQQVVGAAAHALLGARIANVAPQSKADCALMELGPGQCRYALRYWLTDPQYADRTDSVVRLHLIAALERAGIALSLPKQLAFEAAERERDLHARETERRIAALRKVYLFSPLSEDEVHTLARHLARAPFLAGEVITRQGAAAHWLYLLVSGTAEVWLESADAPRRRVALLEPGTVFGEMGMLTGEPRRATVIARSDVLCYRLDKPGFEEILRARPALAQAMSNVLASRANNLSEVLEEAKVDASPERSLTLLERIQAFFGIDAGQNDTRRAA